MPALGMKNEVAVAFTIQQRTFCVELVQAGVFIGVGAPKAEISVGICCIQMTASENMSNKFLPILMVGLTYSRRSRLY